ncbi:Mbov_0121 family peptidase domain-containing ABC transporter [Mycoplasmopsis bovirhinis]|uniref:Cobalt transporter ATP-binding subunit n=1 Tax=Mycoplasmopsis bovirhinis TaxID=29553 RepID=A0A449ACN5_9BACT|nr:ATP-binding cassette domain-containing protein [Mycoplasmopsis bovirhinis]VEU62807.1 cobalt transporter ATP-binding subunit [Mycoplasmopsis bovirhinis]
MLQNKKQISPWDCSLYVFREYLSIKKYQDIPLEELKFKANYNQEGISLEDYNSLLKEFGYYINAYNAPVDQISSLDSSELPFGAIISTGNYSHMVLILKKGKHKITYYDPGTGQKVQVSFKEFSKFSKNIYIEFIKQDKVVGQKQEQTLKEDISKNQTIFGLFQITKNKIILLIVLLFELGLYILIPWVNKRILNIIIPYKLKDELIFIAILILISFLFIYLIQTLSYQITRSYYYKYSYKQLFEILSKFQKENYCLLNNMPNIEIKNRLGNLFYVLNIQEVFLANFVVNCIGFVVSLLILRNINLVLLLVLFAFGILILIISYLKKLIYEKKFLKIQSNSYYLETKSDNFIKALKENQEDFLTRRILTNWYKDCKNFKDEILEFEITNNQINSFHNIVEISLHLFISMIGVLEVWNQRMEFVNFVYFLTSINLFIRPLKGFFNNFDSYIEYMQKIKTIEIFYKNPKIYLPVPKIQETIKSLQLSYAEFRYNQSKQAIINIGRLIFKDKVHIVGKNGKGKSTIAKLIAGILPLNKGEIFVNEKISYLFYNDQLKEQILYLNSDRTDLDLKVKDFLMINDQDGLLNLLNKSSFINTLNAVNLDLNYFLDNNINGLSKGQLAIVKILKLFLRDYDVIIFDEVFENLSFYVYSNLKNLLGEFLDKKLVVEISHSNRFVFDENYSEVNLDEIL